MRRNSATQATNIRLRPSHSSPTISWITPSGRRNGYRGWLTSYRDRDDHVGTNQSLRCALPMCVIPCSHCNYRRKTIVMHHTTTAYAQALHYFTLTKESIFPVTFWQLKGVSSELVDKEVAYSSTGSINPWGEKFCCNSSR